MGGGRFGWGGGGRERGRERVNLIKDIVRAFAIDRHRPRDPVARLRNPMALLSFELLPGAGQNWFTASADKMAEPHP